MGSFSAVVAVKGHGSDVLEETNRQLRERFASRGAFWVRLFHRESLQESSELPRLQMYARD